MNSPGTVGAETESVFLTSRRIEFSDTDTAGIVHFSRFYVFMETAEHQFLNHLGTSVHARDGARLLGWPRLEASCRFLRPVRFEDELSIELRIARLGTKSVTYEVTFRHAGELVASGRIASVCCELSQGERPRAVPIPAELRARMQETMDTDRQMARSEPEGNFATELASENQGERPQ